MGNSTYIYYARHIHKEKKHHIYSKFILKNKKSSIYERP